MNRIERDRDFGDSILEQCEDFMVGNVEAGIRPSFKNLKSYERVAQAIEEIFGPVNPKKKPIQLPKTFKKNLEELVKAQEAIERAKEAEKKAKEAVEEAQKRYEELQLPIIEEMKTAPKGQFVDEDGTHYEISYDVRNALDVEMVKERYPEAYDECNKPSVDTKTLKRLYPDIYRDCFGPKVGGKRTFSLDTWRTKKVMVLVGTISKTIYERDNFSIRSFRTREAVELPDGSFTHTVSIMGDFIPTAYLDLKVEGEFDTKPYINKAGRKNFTFKVTNCEEIKIAEEACIIKYLVSLKGVGIILARRIYKTFGLQTFDILDTDIENLKQVPGIGKRKYKTIAQDYLARGAAKKTIRFFV
jgi:hypothetical protein